MKDGSKDKNIRRWKRMTKEDYLVFIDEYGTPTYKGLEKDNNKFFFMGAIAIKIKDYNNIVKEIINFKSGYYYHPEYLLHYQDVDRRKKIPFKKFNKQLESKFHNDFQQLITKLNVKVFGILLHKKEVYEKHGESSIHPYYTGIQMLLERFLYLRKKEVYLILEKRGEKNEDKKIKEALDNIKQFGYASSNGRFKSSFYKELKALHIKYDFIKKTRRISGLELADFFASTHGKYFRDVYTKGNTWNILRGYYNVFNKKKVSNKYIAEIK